MADALLVDGATVGTQGSLSLRPEKIKLGVSLPSDDQDEVHFKGKVHDCLYMGDVTIYIIELENGTLVETMLPNSDPGKAKFFDDNDQVELAWRFDAGHFLPA